MAGEPRPRKSSARIQLSQECLVSIQAQVTENPGQVFGMDTLDAQGRERLPVIRLRKLVVVRDAPRGLLLPEGDRRIAETDHHRASQKLRAICLARTIGYRPG